jgi:hypothetical protein
LRVRYKHIPPVDDLQRFEHRGIRFPKRHTNRELSKLTRLKRCKIKTWPPHRNPAITRCDWFSLICPLLGINCGEVLLDVSEVDPIV